MEDAAEAQVYDDMQHQEVNERFVADLKRLGTIRGKVLDVGTGTGRIPILLCQQIAEVECLACDASSNMLDIARRNLTTAGLADRIHCRIEDAKQLSFPDQSFELVISNSLIHHLPDPRDAFAEMVRVTRRGGRLFLRDLFRPESKDQIERLVAIHAAGESKESQQLLRQSLAAALTVMEIRQIVRQLGFSEQTVLATSDRHWTWTAVRADE